MPDIVWAAQRIEDGKIVKRKDWVYEGRWDGIRKHDARPYSGGMAGRTGLSLEDLLADDWEVVDE